MATTVTYQIEHWNDIIGELKDCFLAHWDEVALDKDTILLDPDWFRYDALDRAGILHTITVRKNGVLIGYHVSLVGGHLHYASTLHAQVDIYYIKPEFRKGRTPINMFKYAEDSLRNIGVKKIYTGCKTHFDHSRLFEFMDYRKTEIVYTKIL